MGDELLDDPFGVFFIPGKKTTKSDVDPTYKLVKYEYLCHIYLFF